MSMKLGDRLRVTLFGESHGRCVGALLEGLPAGTPINNDALIEFIDNDDIAFSKIAQGAKITGATLPSGLCIPKNGNWSIYDKYAVYNSS